MLLLTSEAKEGFLQAWQAFQLTKSRKFDALSACCQSSSQQYSSGPSMLRSETLSNSPKYLADRESAAQPQEDSSTTTFQNYLFSVWITLLTSARHVRAGVLWTILLDTSVFSWVVGYKGNIEELLDLFFQMGSFFVEQGAAMDRRMFNGGFTIPAASLAIFNTLGIILLIPIYDRGLVPLLRYFGKKLTHLQRIGQSLSALKTKMIQFNTMYIFSPSLFISWGFDNMLKPATKLQCKESRTTSDYGAEDAVAIHLWTCQWKIIGRLHSCNRRLAETGWSTVLCRLGAICLYLGHAQCCICGIWQTGAVQEGAHPSWGNSAWHQNCAAVSLLADPTVLACRPVRGIFCRSWLWKFCRLMICKIFYPLKRVLWMWNHAEMQPLKHDFFLVPLQACPRTAIDERECMAVKQLCNLQARASRRSTYYHFVMVKSLKFCFICLALLSLVLLRNWAFSRMALRSANLPIPRHWRWTHTAETWCRY